MMVGGRKEKRTGADEAGNRRGRGRPRGPLSEEEKKNEKNKKDRDYRAKIRSQFEEYKAFCEEPGINDKFKAYRQNKKQEFKEELKQLDEDLMKDGTNELILDVEMLTGNLPGSSNVASNCEGELQSSTIWTMPLTVGAMNSTATGGIGTRFELKRKREEELVEARRDKLPATADNYPPPHLPIGGSQPSGLMANACQTARQSALPCHSNWKGVQQSEGPKSTNLSEQRQHLDVSSWTTAFMQGIDSQVDPVSLGFHCRKRPLRESCCIEVVISKMRNQMSEMQERLQQIEDSFDAQIQRSVVAALSQFGSCLQANAPIVSPTEPHHDSLGMQGVTNAAAGSSGGPTTQCSPHNEEILLKEYEAFCEELRITGKFKAFREKKKEEFKEEIKKLEEDLMNDGTNESFDEDIVLNSQDPEMWRGYLAGSSNVAFNCEGELQSSDTWTTPLTAGVMNSTATGEPHHDPLGMQGGTAAAAAAAAAGSSGGAQSSPHNEKV